MNDLEKILILGPTPPPYGGIATFVEEVLKSNLKNEYNLLHINTNRNNSKSLKENINVFLRVTFQLLYLLSYKRPKLVHIHASSYLSFWEKTFFAFISKLYLRKVVYHIHGGAFKQFYEQSLFKKIIRFCFYFFDGIIVLSDNWKNYLHEQNLTYKEKIFVVNNFVDLNVSKPKQTVNVNYNVTFVGRLEKSKGIYELLNAIPHVLNKYKYVNFVLVGPYEKKDFIRINSFLKQHNICNNVFLTGPISKLKVYQELSKSKIFVLPSHVEAFPISILEAMGIGLPIIATPIGDVPEIVENNINGFLIKENDFLDMANKIMYLIENEELRLKMVNNNLKKFNEKYNINTACGNLKSVYESIL
ncbi:glycosyl transferase group 1 (plasmid) [Methanohalobium evestigatum Z-7303]|uniref:Glycosyl transferase group 1 n=1 Tax=Methanohalobium evestigatum (strain ATCC BAA-1072 / DSM 3721 / NBRC 107634 / OCM 161 / Z-7303) TaxID=644295 RepID=D7EBY0_METEZ|nr:glycosyltransferase family 4 protein [Methanohalobium evestigatum]ADI75102.1 glycosyl transferase group 1 [Methanohalobium evestigatum Z-7303]